MANLRMIDVIVPTIKGREESLERCLDSFERTAMAALNAIIIRDSETCGGGWREGLERSTAPYVLLACDDQEALSDGWAEICMETADEGHIPCPRVWLANGTIESQGGDMSGSSTRSRGRRRTGRRSDYTTVPFLSREATTRSG